MDQKIVLLNRAVHKYEVKCDSCGNSSIRNDAMVYELIVLIKCASCPLCSPRSAHHSKRHFTEDGSELRGISIRHPNGVYTQGYDSALFGSIPSYIKNYLVDYKEITNDK